MLFNLVACSSEQALILTHQIFNPLCMAMHIICTHKLLSRVSNIYQMLAIATSFETFATALGTLKSSAPRANLQSYGIKAGGRCKTLSSFPFSLGEVWGAKQWQTKVTWPTTPHLLRCWPAERTPEAGGRREGKESESKQRLKEKPK